MEYLKEKKDYYNFLKSWFDHKDYILTKTSGSTGKPKEIKLKNRVTFGFYNSLIFFIVIAIFLSRGLYFSQDFIIEKLPATEFYLEYFFESIRNLFEIWKNLISNY